MIHLKNFKKPAILSIIICLITAPTPALSADECSIPTLPGIDISKVKIVKNSSSRDKKIEQYVRRNAAQELAYALNNNITVSYSYNKVDLDGDGKPEILLRIYSISCGTLGCPIHILKINGSGYSVIDSTLSHGRYIFTSNETNGFKDMIHPYFNRSERMYLSLKYLPAKKGYIKVKEYTKNLKVKGTAYLVCGESFPL